MTGPNPPGPEPPPGLHPTPAPPGSSRLPDPGHSGPGQRSSAEQVERPHPLTPLVRSWVLVLALAFAFGREALNETLGGGDPFTSPFPPDDFAPRFFGTELSVQWLGLIVPAILLLIVGFGYLSWRATASSSMTRYFGSNPESSFAKSQRIAFDKVQSIDLLQPFAARLLGELGTPPRSGRGFERATALSAAATCSRPARLSALPRARRASRGASHR